MRPDAPRPAATVTAVDADGVHELVSEMRLVPLDGGAPHVVNGRVTIGTSEVADVRVSDRTVSRLHCDVTVDRGRARVRDLGSRNGTLVDGVQVLDAYLASGSVIRVGSHDLRFEVGEEQQRFPLSRLERFGDVVGRSVAMRRVFAQLEQAAASDATLLLLGETGTGKEVVAESVRSASSRRDGPFIIVDCGAMPADLLESELFGHEKGAFTSAATARTGAFEAAHGGTIFLDEIGELPLELQPKLLRALSKREIKRIGRNDYRPIDVRVIAATNRDLLQEIDRKAFRADLYYRLAVIEVRLPPLRERLEDMPLLVEAILDDIRGDARVKARILETESVKRLSRYAWPGNVRELRNYLERSVVAGAPGELQLDPAASPPPPPASATGPALPAIDPARALRESRDEWLAAFERQYLAALLEAHGGNIRAAAGTAGIDRVYLYRLLWKHGLR